jgi:hypothetical protein
MDVLGGKIRTPKCLLLALGARRMTAAWFRLYDLAWAPVSGGPGGEVRQLVDGFVGSAAMGVTVFEARPRGQEVRLWLPVETCLRDPG